MIVFILSIVTALLVQGVPLSAQTRATTADFEGIVRDQSGAVLPEATVTARHLSTGLVRVSVTGSRGEFAMLALPLGTYTITVELEGFATLVQKELSFTLGSRVNMDYTLQIGAVTQRVMVTAGSPLLDTQNTAVSSVISQQQIDNLPINGRDFISFAVIAPGVNVDRTPQQGASATSGLTFSGQRGRSNNITVDGLDNNDSVLGSVRATFSQEAIREFHVITNSYSAEFGKASGGVLNIVTRSGGNNLSGSGFYFFRDDALNRKGYLEKFNPAGDAINRKKAPFSQHQFGGTAGGPIRRDRTFFFLSFERLDVGTNNFVTIDDQNVVGLFGRPLGTPADILRANGFPVETGSVPYDFTSDQFLAKADHLITPGQTLSLRVNWADILNENIEPWGGQVARSRGALLDSSDFAVAGSHTLVLRSRAVNEFRSQVAHRNQDVLSLDPACNGRCERDDQGGPTLEVTGFASVGRQRFTPQPRENLRFQALNTTTYVAGSHTFKAGIDYNYIDHTKQSLPLHFGGRYIFAPLPPIPGLLPASISSIQALALGLPAAYVQGYGKASSLYSSQDLSLFVQDDWRLRPNVTLKLGVRYQNQFWPDIAFENPLVGAYPFPSDNNNIAPRLAAAWDPFADKRTSIHGAYGIFYDNHVTGLPGITDIVDGSADGVRTLVAAFPISVAAWNAPGRRLPESAFPSFPSTVIGIDPNARTPYAHHASVGMNRELPGQMTVSADFVSVRGFDQLGTLDYNPVLPDLGASRRPQDVNGRAGTSASVLQYTSFSQTWYDGLTVMLRKRFDAGYQLLANYTLSRAEDNTTDFQANFIVDDNGRGRNPADLNGLPLGFDPDAERGPSLQDQRHRFVFSGLYSVPWDIQVASIATVGSGRPYNILAGVDVNGDGNGGSFPPDRARGVIGDPTTRVRRNSGRLPAQAVVDLRVSRRVPFEGTARMDLIFEVFNLFNRTNVTEVDNIFGVGSYPSNPSPSFGQWLQVAAPLQVQVGLRASF